MVAPPPTDPGVEYEDSVTLITSDAVGVINFHSLAGTGSSHNNACRMIYDTLYYLNPDNSTSPMLATSYATSDFETWVFKLRDDVYFHNGDKFTARDVVYTFNASREAPGSVAYDMWGWVETATAIDDYTVELKLIGPYGNLLMSLALPMTGIINERAIAADPVEGYWIGTGAYKIAAFSTSDSISFVRNDDYWGEIPFTQYQTWRYIPEQSSRTIMLQTGAAHLGGGLAELDIKLFEEDDKFNIYRIVADTSMDIMFNLADPICGDLNFRLAVAHAIDRIDLAIFAAGDNALPIVDGTVWAYSSPYKNMNLQLRPRDLALAQQYLADSSYNGETIELTVMSSGIRMGEAVQEQLSLVGISTVINPMDVPSFLSYSSVADNKAQMLIWFCLTGSNPASSYKNNFHPSASNNRMSYNNEELTQMIDTAHLVFGEDAQREHYYRMQELVYEDIPCLSVYRMISALVYAEGVGGFVLASHGHYDYRYTYVIAK